ncbi:pentatricopeptide repeat-containing protein At2g03880, mitochondrial-like [Elaeis guineensis]|uniref:pentatricopeptide repeat-containing protein At2g03880, mitochondrial-like n=1 Tax=Elaeis guineensis var. tenera TaxID=51953 RepID=UPI003C6D1697
MPTFLLCTSSSPVPPTPSHHPLYKKSTSRNPQETISLKAVCSPGVHSITSANDTIIGPTSCINDRRNVLNQDKLTLSLLHEYTRAGRMREARALFNAMPDKTLVSWTILMSGYTLHGHAIEAMSLFRQMLRLPSDDTLQPDPFVFSVVLRACASIGSVDLGREIHCSILKLCYMEDLFVANALVTMYASCGSVQYSARVFWGIHQPDLVSWSSMLSGYVKNGHYEEALRLFSEMAQAGVQFDAFVLSIVLKASANLGCTNFGIQIHSCMVKMGLDSCLFLENCLMEFYGRAGELGIMRQVFDKMLEKDLVSWNTIITCCTHNFYNEEALMLFRALIGEGSECDEFTLGSTLQAVASLKALNHGKEIHGYVIRAGFESDSHVNSALLDMYIKCIDHETSDYRSNMVPRKIFRSLQSMGAEFDEFIMASILKSCAMQKDLETGKMIHACIMKLEIKLDAYVISSLIDMYAKCGILEASLRVFEGTKKWTTVPWSAIIAAHCWNGHFLEALRFFRKMQLDQVNANEFTYTSVLLACTALGSLRRGKEIHCHIIRNGYESNVSVVNSLINLYSGLSKPQQALKLCSTIFEHEISWGSLIKALAEAKDYEIILKLFHRIQRSNGQLDHASACFVLNSCGSAFFLNAGIQAHTYITKKGLVSSPNMSNALIKMYSNCGNLAHAIDVFNQMTERKSASWTSMISANVHNGCPSSALELFMLMIRKGKNPNSNTFVSVLKACAQMGLVDEAFRLFVSMTEVYKIKPSAQHYCCMVEVLGQVGMLREAEHFIDSVIPFEPGAPIWKALLSSSRVYENMKVAKHAAERLVELEPTDIKTNILLQQVLLASGKWEDVARLRKRSLKTSSSWIEIRENVHEFVSGQIVTMEISNKLGEVARMMEELGYVADKNHWLHNVEDSRGKGTHHAELMALAYGLVSLPHGTPIRVFMNARMCGACHSSCKFISTFVRREVVIKDTCKFHHFKDGKCSCKDRW